MSPLHLDLRDGRLGRVLLKPRTSCLSAWYMFRRARGRPSSGSLNSLILHAFLNAAFWEVPLSRKHNYIVV